MKQEIPVQQETRCTVSFNAKKKKMAAVCSLSQREIEVYNNHLSLYIQYFKFISEVWSHSYIVKT